MIRQCQNVMVRHEVYGLHRDTQSAHQFAKPTHFTCLFQIQIYEVLVKSVKEQILVQQLSWAFPALQSLLCLWKTLSCA